LLSAEPKDIVLRPVDVEPGFHVTAESIASAVQVWRSTPSVVEPNVRRTPGFGDYVLLARTDGPTTDGVISVASSAVRYESTRVARTQFAFDAEPPDVDHTLSIDMTTMADEFRAWRHTTAVVVVDQVLLRRLNLLLSLTVVRAPYAPGEDVAARYLKVMRARLRD
jgi:hypothetical protein